MSPKKYDLFVQVKGRWIKVAVVEAANRSAALRHAMYRLAPEYYDKPIRLEQQPPDKGTKT